MDEPSLTDKANSSTVIAVHDSKSWIEKKPILSVVCSVVKTKKWHQLGIQLNVDETSLTEIDKNNPSGLKKTRMFEEWLKTQPNATNRQLLNALRLKVVGEDTLAEQYEERIKTDHSVLTTRDSPNVTGIIIIIIHSLSHAL